jgi:hypothetical protein
MNDRGEQQELLDDVLAESSSPDFRASLLGETLRLARQRRRWRHTRQAGGVLATLILLAIISRQNQPENQPEKISTAHPLAKPIAVATSYHLVETQPLSAGAMVASVNFPAVKMISSESAVTQIATTGGNFRLINDEQLLALLMKRPAILIRTGPNSEELIFANPEDQKGFPVN